MPDEQGKGKCLGGRPVPRSELATGGSGLSCVPNSPTFVLCTAVLPEMMQGFADTKASSETRAFTAAIAKQYVHTGGRNRVGKYQ